MIRLQVKAGFMLTKIHKVARKNKMMANSRILSLQNEILSTQEQRTQHRIDRF